MCLDYDIKQNWSFKWLLYGHILLVTQCVSDLIRYIRGSVNSTWGESEAQASYWIHSPCIYCIKSLAHCVTNMSYWLCLNEGFRCNCIKINKYYNFCVVCKWSKCVAITIFGDLFNVTSIKSLNQHLGKNLHWSIVISKKKICL